MMGATSVTGRGVGSAESTAKGPKERNFVGVEKLIGPRNMLAVQVTLVAGAALYTFAEVLDGGAADYNVMTQADNAVTVTKNVDGDGNLESVTLAGVGVDVVDLLVVKVGIAI